MQNIRVTSPTNTYSILIGEGLLAQIGWQAKQLGFSGTCALVTNPTVGQYYAETVLENLRQAGFSPVLCQIPDGESHKTLATVADLYDQFFKAGLDRKSLVLALGGGVIGDTAGFAAASFLRGLPFIQIPTTVLSMVDASVGAKTGVNLPHGKNLVGAFKQPELVLVDPSVLDTLHPAEYRSGMAEVIKHGILGAPHLFSALQNDNYDRTWMLSEAIQVKVDVVQEDPFERGRRAVLNLGHTFGHAFEKLSHYEIRHGEGVAIGMACAAKLAVDLGECSGQTAEEIITLVEAIELPTQVPDFDVESIWQAMGADKKKEAGKLRFILPRAIGNVDIYRDIPDEKVKAMLVAAQSRVS